MKYTYYIFIVFSLLMSSCSYRGIVQPFGPLPTQDQLALQDMEMYAFLHYSLNTYTNQ